VKIRVWNHKIVHIYKYMYTYIYIYIYIYTYIHIYTYIYTHTYIYNHTYTITHTYAFTHTYTYIYIYIYIYIYTHLYIFCLGLFPVSIHSGEHARPTHRKSRMLRGHSCGFPSIWASRARIPNTHRIPPIREFRPCWLN
jgi:hypothetical protein